MLVLTTNVQKSSSGKHMTALAVQLVAAVSGLYLKYLRAAVSGKGSVMPCPALLSSGPPGINSMTMINTLASGSWMICSIDSNNTLSAN